MISTFFDNVAIIVWLEDAHFLFMLSVYREQNTVWCSTLNGGIHVALHGSGIYIEVGQKFVKVSDSG